MKVKKLCTVIIAIIAAIICAASCTVFSACIITPAKSYEQQINYSESVAEIANPDQGFYRPIYVTATDGGVSYHSYIVTAATRLYHLRIDISAFSSAVNGESDKALPQSVLDGLDGLLSYLKERDKNAIIRFAYDPRYEGSSNKEPSLQMILKHIEQVCPIISNYASTVTAIEAGLIGPWGEMHSSAIANADYINPIIGAFLSQTEDIPVLVRTPKMIYNYLGITINDIDDYTIAPDSEAYRLGLYNDGYLGSSSDLGTYTNREREVEFLSRQTEHLPYGGEVVIPSSELHDIDVCLPEMFEIHLSYLNIEWNNYVIDKWKNSLYTAECGADAAYYGKTAFEYIRNRMGYRYVVKKSTFKYSDRADKLQVELNFDNVGFGNLNKSKRAKLIFAGSDGSVAYTKEVKSFTGGNEFKFSADINLGSGEYDVYLQLYGDELDGEPLYLVQFANVDIWNADLKANKIGSIEVK